MQNSEIGCSIDGTRGSVLFHVCPLVSSMTLCGAYFYPQLYYRYWEPFTEHSDWPTKQLSSHEISEIQRLREGPLYLPRP